MEDRAMPRLFLNRAQLLGAAVLFYAPVVAQELAPAGSSMSRGRNFDEQGGAALYASVCAACHQPDAKGAIGAAAYPPLVANKNLASAGYVTTVLLDGLGGMPPVGRMMSDAQVADVTNYVRSHFGNGYEDTVSPADVRAARPENRSNP
jgi:mono/diheme cytochrome c family protein